MFSFGFKICFAFCVVVALTKVRVQVNSWVRGVLVGVLSIPPSQQAWHTRFDVGGPVRLHRLLSPDSAERSDGARGLSLF